MMFGRRKRREKAKREALQAEISHGENVVRSMSKAGWRPDLGFKSAVARHTGVYPQEGEAMIDHVARATGSSVYQVESFIRLMAAGKTAEEADVAVFGKKGQSRLHGALEAVRQATVEAARALDRGQEPAYL